MKWIGQNVYDFISRFRNDVYLESISSGTIASGGNLGLDSNNKIVKAAVADGDITGVTAGAGLSGGGSSGAVTLNLDLTSSLPEVAPANGDAILMLDSDSTTEQISEVADLATLFAGTGLTASSSVINVDAAQSGITSLGTLTGLTIDGDKSVTPGDGAMLHIDTSTITDSNTGEGGTAALYTHARIEGPTLAATEVNVTTTDAATLYVTRSQVGTNQTLTNSWGIYTNGGTFTGGLTNSANYAQTAGDITLYDATNNANPTISLGSSATERLKIESIYESGAQGLDEVRFTTYTAGSSANDGRFTFYVDETNTIQIKDSLLNIMQNGKLTIGNVDILSDSSGTTTLNNIDALDATTEATIESAIDTLGNLTSASSLATVGTITSGTWQGTAIASAYLDADTAHISTTKQLTHHGISDDIDSDVVYISLLESDAENTSHGNKHLPIIAPAAGKLLKIFVRTTVDQSSETFTWKLYTRTTSQSTNGAAAEIGAQSGAGPTNKTMVTYDFTTGLDSGTNVIGAGDKVLISLEAGDGATANGGYFITCLWEWDLS